MSESRSIPVVWRDDFESSHQHAIDPRFKVPSGADLKSLCDRYEFPGRAVEVLMESRHTWDDPMIERLGSHFQWLVRERYRPSTFMELGYPPPPSSCPLFYAYSLIGMMDPVARDQAALGLDPAITRATFADIGQQVTLHDRIRDAAPFTLGWWLTHHLSGHLFRIGRLQFQRSILGTVHGLELEGQHFLDVHIPEDGRLDPVECDRSFADAAEFASRHFPEDDARWFGCTSWLLDPVLGDLLPHESNLLQFQRRFRMVDIDHTEPSRVFEFVFDRPDLDESAAPDLDALVGSSTLRRGIIDLYRSGGRVRSTTGMKNNSRQMSGSRIST